MGSQPPFRQEKFRSDLNGPKSNEMSERLLKTLRKSGDFQAEYEGSLWFWRRDTCLHEAATHRQPDARKQIAADSVDGVERGHDISRSVDPVHGSGARYERATKHRSRHRAF